MSPAAVSRGEAPTQLLLLLRLWCPQPTVPHRILSSSPSTLAVKAALSFSLSLSLSRYRHENQYSTDCRRTSPGRGARGDLVRRPDVPAVAASRRPGADRFPAQSSFPRCRPSIRLIPGLRRAGERTCCFDWRSLPGAAATKGARSAGFDDPPPSTPQNTRRRRAPSDEVRFLKTSV